MFKPIFGRKTKAAALYLVLGTLIVVVILARVMLAAILTQARISRHHAGRIQAYYAALAGTNYAREMLRTGAWHYNGPGDNSCPPTAVGSASPCDVTESEFPASISTLGTGTNRQFRVVFCPGDPAPQLCAPSKVYCDNPDGYNFCIQVSVKYTSPDVST
jgi:Tfp pilus assembly protein PilX